MTESSFSSSEKEISALLANFRATLSAINSEAEMARATSAEVNALFGTIQTNGNLAKESSSQAAAALESIRSAATAAVEGTARIEALKTQVEQVAQVAATRSDHIEEGRKYVDSRRADIDIVMNSAQQSATQAESHHTASRTAFENITSIYNAAQAVKANTDGAVDAISAARAAVEGHAVITKRLAEIASGVESKIGQYEAQLQDLQVAADSQRKNIDELLLGATNAGLASAFDKRSKTFQWPGTIWQGVFIASLAGLLGLAFVEARSLESVSKVPDWQELTRLLLHRLPFLLPLVWLAIHAARQASFAKRMEEEYAFKATVSTSFEGYRRQMAEVSKDLSPESPLARLCIDTLATISIPPGKIYDKHRMDPTPATAASEFIDPLANKVAIAVSKALAARLPDLKA